ncbi:MAG: glycosyltransferase [Chitinivibrionales bacterium]|nr:glycosyltransferase [Chitinivibrionales bacterium]
MHSVHPLISLIIVNYKVAHEIRQLLRSVREAELFDRCEVIIVDNASGDDSETLITKEFSFVQWIALKNNIGFGKACNVAFQKSQGAYVLLINPDTLISQNTLRISYEFMESRPDVGIFGPKIIMPDGTFQYQCRRSFPTPTNSLAYFLKLHKLFPKNPRFGQYIYTSVSPEVSMEVDAVSGSYMFIRHDVFKQLSGFDEAFFMYGEDIDLCARCRHLGYKVWYYPKTQIIHFKGKSGAKNMLRTRIAFYQAMIIFSKKHQHSYGGFLPGWMLNLGIMIQSIIGIGASLVKSFTAGFIDLFIINIVLWTVMSLRFHGASMKIYGDNGLLMVLLHSLLSLCFLCVYAYQGIYLSKRYSIRNVLLSSGIASIFFLTAVFFIKSIAFSRIVFAASVVLISALLIGWRSFLPLIWKNLSRRIYSTGRVLILGNTTIASALLKNLEQDKSARICGIIWPYRTGDTMPGEFNGYPVVGTLDSLGSVLKRYKIDLLLIATQESWYSSIIEALTFSHLRHLTIRWVPHELFQMPTDQLPTPIPLNDFSI